MCHAKCWSNNENNFYHCLRKTFTWNLIKWSTTIDPIKIFFSLIRLTFCNAVWLNGFASDLKRQSNVKRININQTTIHINLSQIYMFSNWCRRVVVSIHLPCFFFLCFFIFIFFHSNRIESAICSFRCVSLIRCRTAFLNNFIISNDGILQLSYLDCVCVVVVVLMCIVRLMLCLRLSFVCR